MRRSYATGDCMHLQMFAMPFLILGLVLQAASAEPVSVSFVGEQFVQKHTSSANKADQFAEFGLVKEPIDKWNKLLVFHYHPQSDKDASRAAAQLAKIVLQRYKGADIRILKNDANGEAMIHFMLAAPNSDIVEVNVFKYAKAPGQDGLISAQVALRFELGEADPNEIKQARMRAVDEMARFPMQTVADYFAAAK
jgi:hypothetical protein